MAYPSILELTLHDPVMKALHYHQIRWEDVPFTPEEEKANQEWLQQPEQVRLQNAISQELRNLSSNKIRTIIARNLPRNITTSELQNIFEMFGPVDRIIIPYHLNPLNPYYGTMKGYAFITFLSANDALLACFPEYSESSYIVLSNKIVTLELAKEDR